jgi:hypothetical protein
MGPSLGPVLNIRRSNVGPTRTDARWGDIGVAGQRFYYNPYMNIKPAWLARFGALFGLQGVNKHAVQSVSN